MLFILIKKTLINGLIMVYYFPLSVNLIIFPLPYIDIAIRKNIFGLIQTSSIVNLGRIPKNKIFFLFRFECLIF